MVSLADLQSWWNLMFLVPIGVALLLLLLGAATGLGDDDGGHGDGHGDGGHADGGGHEPGDADGHGDADGDSDADGHHGLGDGLKAFGVGTVPLTLLLPGFLLFFGIVGLAANRFLDVAAAPEGRIAVALVLAAVGGLAGMAGLGAAARRFLPKDVPALAGRDLIARTGRVVFTVTPEGGTIQIRDAGGTLHQVGARVPAGHDSIEAGREVIVVARDAESGIFTVDESPFG